MSKTPARSCYRGSLPSGRRILANTLLLLAAIAPPAYSQWPSPFTAPNSLGSLLEDGFTRAVTDCGLPGVFHGREHPSRRRTAIPPTVRSNLPLNTRVRDQGTINAGRIFAYIYPSDNAARSLQTPDNNRLVAVDVSQDPVTMLDPGTSSLAHTHSCRSVVAATLEANAGITVPAAHVKTALQSEFNRSHTTLMVLTHGQFHSPLAFGLGSTGATPAQQLQARLLVWDWYQKHPASTSSSNWYITGFRGGTIYRTVNANQDVNGGFDLRTGAAAPGIASVEAALKAALNLDVQTQVNHFRTFHYLDGAGQPALQLATLPAPVAIANEITALVRPQLQSDLNTPLTDLQPHFHYTEITGVPENLCNAVFWDVNRPAGGIGTLALTKVESMRDRPLVCRYTISYQLATLSPAGTVDLSYNLVSRQGVGAARISIPVTVTLSTEEGPAVRLRVHNPNWEEPVQANTLRWTIPLQVYDKNNVINFAQPVGLTQDALVCASTSEPINVSQPTVGAGNALTITLERPIAGTNFDLAAQRVECTFTGVLTFATSGGGSLRRTVPAVRILYPSKSVAPTPSPGPE